MNSIFKIGKKLDYLGIFCLYAAVFLMIALLAQFNFPQSDDFRFEFQFRDSRSIWDYLVSAYVNDGSRLGGSIWQILIFQVEGFFKYKLAPISLFALLSLSVTYLISGLFKQMDSARTVSLGLLIVLAYIAGMPDFPSGFFWMTASVSTFLEAIFLFALGIIAHKGIQHLRAQHWILLSIVLLFFLNSGEIHMAYGLALVCMAIFIAATNGSIPRWVIITMTVIVIATIVFYFLSPAFYSRVSDTQSVAVEQSIITRLLFALGNSLLQYWSWLMDPRLLLLFGFGLFLPTQLVLVGEKSTFSIMGRQLPVQQVFLILIPLFGLGTLIVFSIVLGNHVPKRLLNFHFLTLLIWAVFSGAFLSQYIKREHTNSGWIYRTLILSFLVLSFGISDLRPNNAFSIVRDLGKKEGQKFMASQQKRQIELENCTTDTCFVSPLEAYPKSFYRYHPNNEVLTERGFKKKGAHFINEYYVRGYGKQAVFLDSNNNLGYDYYYWRVLGRN